MTPPREQDAAQAAVSCVMPTANRPVFARRAIELFLAQDHPHRELLVVDDGTEPIADLVPDDPRIRYLRLGGRRTLGAKRNICVEEAAHDLVMHWDDDDWMAPTRISTQVGALVAGAAEVCGMDRLLFHHTGDHTTWLYRYGRGAQRAWLAGGTLLYTKDFWRRSPFPDVQVGSDTRFVWNRSLSGAAVVDDLSLYVATIHASNTSRRHVTAPNWTRYNTPLAEAIGVDFRCGLPGLCGPRVAAPPRPPSSGAERPMASTPPGSRQLPPLVVAGARHVTVSIPHHGGGDHLRTAVESILGQTHADLTCVVVFDGDRSGAAAIDHLDDPRLVRHVLPENRGRYFADQVVLEATSSDYFLVQDSDDWSEPERVEQLLAELERTGADVCLSDEVHHDRRSEPERTSRHSRRRLDDPVGPRFVHRGHQGLYRRKILRAIGGWYAGYRIGFDSSVLNFVMLAGGRVVSVPEPLYHRVIRHGSLTTSSTTGWNTAERRRVGAELGGLHRRMVAATRGVSATKAGSIIRARVEAGRGSGHGAEIRREAGRLATRLTPTALQQAGSDVPSSPRRSIVGTDVGMRRPDLHGLLERHGTANPKWSISVPAALELYHRLMTARPQRVLDVGSGISTAVAAVAAARYGGRVVGLEHDPEHAATTTAMLLAAGLDDVAEVVVAPLVECAHPCGTGPWYRGQPEGEFDFVVVDGPPLGDGGRVASFPALIDHLRRDWELWLFDAHRAEEQRCLAAWQDHFRFDVSVERIDPTGVAVLRDRSRTSAPAPVLDRLGISLLTSHRPQLLERTLTSLTSRWPEQVESAYVVALVNGPDLASKDTLDRVGWIDRILSYERGVLPIGTATSIVVAAVTGQAAVDHILHLGDDWETRTVDMDALVRAAGLLRDPSVGQVRLQHRSEPCLGQHMITRVPIRWRQGDGHRRAAAHFTFTPSLISRRVADRVLPAVDERDAQHRFLDTGLDAVQLEPGVFVRVRSTPPTQEVRSETVRRRADPTGKGWGSARLLFWTRFNTLGLNSARETAEWTEMRFRFWLAFTLRSILDQGEGDWRYWLVCSRALCHLTDPLQEAITDPRVELVYDDECCARLAQLPKAERYLLTRVDSDDLYHRGTAATLLAERPCTPFLQFNHGFAIDVRTADVLPWRSRSSPFYTHVYGEEIRDLDVWAEPNHTTVAPSATVLGSGRFLVSLHGGNTSTTRAFASGPVLPSERSAAILGQFGIGGERRIDELMATVRAPIRWEPRWQQLQLELAQLVEEMDRASGGPSLSLPAAALLQLACELSAARAVAVVDDVAAAVVVRARGAVSCRLVVSQRTHPAALADRVPPALAEHAAAVTGALEPHAYDVVYVDLRQTAPDGVRSAVRAVAATGLLVLAGAGLSDRDALRDGLPDVWADRYPEISALARDEFGTTCHLLGRPLTGQAPTP